MAFEVIQLVSNLKLGLDHSDLLNLVQISDDSTNGITRAWDLRTPNLMDIFVQLYNYKIKTKCLFIIVSPFIDRGSHFWHLVDISVSQILCLKARWLADKQPVIII